MHTIGRFDEKGVQVEELIQVFGFHIMNDAAQPPIYWTPRGSMSPEMLRFVGSWRVSIQSRQVGNKRFDTRQADWDRKSGRSLLIEAGGTQA